MDQLQDLSSLVIKILTIHLRGVDDLRTKIEIVKLLFTLFSKELTNLETKLNSW